VFAPSNDAFDKLDADTLAELKNDTARLEKVLLYHVLASKVLSRDLEENTTTVATANNLTLYVTKDKSGKKITIQNNDKSITAKVTTADVDGAINGVAHIIDAVLFPINTLVQVVAATDSLSTLNELLVEAELVDTLSGDGPFTVFAPSNDAFDDLDADTLAGIKNDTAMLKKVLLYHVLASKVLSTDLKVGTDTVVTEDDLILIVKKSSKGKITITNNDRSISAKVTTLDVGADNGVAHIIDKVLIPADDTMKMKGTAEDNWLCDKSKKGS